MKTIGLLVCALAMFGNFSFAAETKAKAAGAKGHMELTTEQRESMAGLHEKMAACLRSSKPMMDCKHEMMAGCKDSMGKGGCPMMSGGMDHGHHHHMMEEKETTKE